MGQSHDGDWYYTGSGQTVGPMNFEQLKAKLTEESPSPPVEMVWSEGMESWIKPEHVDGLTEHDDQATDSTLDEWYYQKNGDKVGPVTSAELKELIADPSIDPPLKMVWREGYKKWQPVYMVADLWEPIPGLKVEIERKRITPKKKESSEPDPQDLVETPEERAKAEEVAREWALADAKRAADNAKAEMQSDGKLPFIDFGGRADFEVRLEQLVREEIAVRGLVPRAQQVSEDEKALAAAKERAELEVKAAEAATLRADEEIRAILAAKERAQEEAKAMEIAKARAEAEQMAAAAARERATEEVKAMEAAHARAIEEAKAFEAKQRADLQANQAREAEARAQEASRLAEIKLIEEEQRIKNEARRANEEELKRIKSEQEVITAAELKALEEARKEARAKAREEADRLAREIQETRHEAEIAAKEAQEARRLAAVEAREAETARMAAAMARQEEEARAAVALKARQEEESRAEEAAKARQLEEQKIEAAAKARQKAEAEAKLAGEAKVKAEREAMEAEQARLVAAKAREAEERKTQEEFARYQQQEAAAKALEKAMIRAAAEAEEARLVAEKARAHEESLAAEAVKRREEEEARAAEAVLTREAEEVKVSEAVKMREAEEARAAKAKELAESHAVVAEKAEAKALKASLVVEAKQERRVLTETQRLVLEKNSPQDQGQQPKGARTQRLEDEKAKREAALEEISKQAKQLALEIEEAKREAAAAAKEAEQARRKAALEAMQAEEARLAAAKARDAEETKAKAALKAREEEEAKMAIVAKAREEEEARMALAKQARQEAEQRSRMAEEVRRIADQDLHLSKDSSVQTKGDSALDHVARQAREIRSRVMEKLWRETGAGRSDLNAQDAHEKKVAAAKEAREKGMQGWYYTFEGDRLGPVTFGELKVMAHAGSLDPRLDMAWHTGMDKWIQAGLVDGLFQRVASSSGRGGKSSPPLPPSRSNQAKPKKTPRNIFEEEVERPGLDRAWFIGLMLSFPFVWYGLLQVGRPYLFRVFGDSMVDAALPYASYVTVGMMVLMVFKRLSNLGMSRVWVLGMIIPFANLWLAYRCVACPAGYEYRKKLDYPGYALAFVYWVLVLCTAWILSFNMTFLLELIEKGKDLPERIQSIISNFGPPAEKP